MTDSIFRELEDAPIWQKIMLVVVFTVIVIYTYKNVIFYDKYKNIKALNKSIKVQEQNIASYQFKLKNKPKVKTINKASQIELMKLNNYAMFITQISALDVTGAKIVNIRPGIEQKKSKYIQKKLYLSIEGKLESTILLLEKIDSNIKSSSIDKTTFSKRKKDLYYTEVFITTYMSK